MKSILTIRIDEELHEFLKSYAKDNHTTVTGVITQYAFYLQKRYGKKTPHNTRGSNSHSNQATDDA